MEAISTQKFIRISPTKIRPLVREIIKMEPNEAVEKLPFISKASALPLAKVIKSAMANAKVKGLDEKTLIFKEIQVMEGPRLKKGMAVSRGRHHPILKRMSHIKVVLHSQKPLKGQSKPKTDNKEVPEVGQTSKEVQKEKKGKEKK